MTESIETGEGDALPFKPADHVAGVSKMVVAVAHPEALRLADCLQCEFAGFEVADVAAAELRRLHAENEALRKDAQRYRWLRALDAGGIQVYYVPVDPHLSIFGDELDAAIDAAIDAAKGESK